MIKRIFPFLGWFKNYGLATLRVDALSGLTVALVLIPQSMAYAQLAGLPPYYGLYASFLPPVVAALFGSIPQLATGPVAVVSLMTAASLAPLATQGSEGYIAYAILLALMVGLVQFLLGLFRLGLVVNFLSHPVLNGFTNAAALIIASSQLPKLFGVHVDSASYHYLTVVQVFREAAHYTHWPSLIMGASAFAVMYGLKHISIKIPNVLVAVAVTTVISWAMGFEHNTSAQISRIESPRAREVIEKFNRSLETVAALSRERGKVTEALDKASRARDMMGILAAEHDASVLAFNIQRLNIELRSQREELRKMLFRAVAQPDGSMRFYLRGAPVSESRSDGRLWRLGVGNNAFDLQKLPMVGGGEVVGSIPRGLPSLSPPGIDPRVLIHLLPYAAIISLLGFMEAISIAKAMAAKTGQRLDPNQELIGQGLANILGSVSKSYPTSGSFSRSAVNLQSGAVTGLSSVFSSLAVIVVLFFFTPLLYHLPQAVLASVIMIAVIGLVNVSGFIHAWQVKWYDGAICVISFFSTLAFAPHLDRGIMVGVVLSLLVFLYKSMRPTVVTLARYEDQSFKDCATFGLKECEYISLVRFEGSLFFANATYLEDKITELRRKKQHLRHIILVSNGINDIDASGHDTLSLLVDRVRSAGIDISMSGLNETVMRVLKRTRVFEKIGEDHIYPTVEKAINSIYADTHEGSREEFCPLMNIRRIG